MRAYNNYAFSDIFHRIHNLTQNYISG